MTSSLRLTDLVDSGRATITLPEWAGLLGVGRNQAYEAAQRGEVPGLLTIGRRRLVSVPVTLAWLGADAGEARKEEPSDAT